METTTKNQILTGHVSYDTAYVVENYPYGRLRTQMRYWIETTPKKGDRFCSCTINPKNGRINAPKKSTYTGLGFMFKNEIGHVKWTGIGIYTDSAKREAFIKWAGIENLLPEQLKMWNQLNGINELKRNEFTDKPLKDYSVKWDREVIGSGRVNGVWNKGEPGKYREVKITFDRPDGVKLIEIFNAMKSLNQTKLNEVFEIRNSHYFGDRPGTVRVCTRGGLQLATVGEAEYKEFLASDHNVMEEEKEAQMTDAHENF